MSQSFEFGLDTFGDVTAGPDGQPQPQAVVIREVIEQAVLADQVGINAFGVGEHHRADFAVASPEMVLAAVASRTKRIRLGSAVTVLSSDDPIRVFQRFSTLDALSNGRAEVMLGRGSFIESFPLFGFDLNDYERLFNEKLDLFAAVLTPDGPAHEPELVADAPPPAPEVPVVHPHEDENVARMRAYRVDAGGKQLHVWRGEFHRHTEYTAHRDGDGLYEDAWRYALDAARLDWVGVGDHDNGFGVEYFWWTMQKVTDLFHHPAAFVAVDTYERSVVYPNGHRNVIWTERGHLKSGATAKRPPPVVNCPR